MNPAIVVLASILSLYTSVSAAAPSYVWGRTWGGTQGDNVNRSAVDSAGNIYVTGGFSGTVDFNPSASTDSHASNGAEDTFLSKFDASGNFLWARTWGGTGRDIGACVGVDSAGNAYVTGPFQNTVDFNPDPVLTDTHVSSNTMSANNMYVSKFDPSGTFVWARTWGPIVAGGEAYSITVDNSDKLYIVGDFSSTTTSLVDFNPWGSHDFHQCHGFFDAFLMKMDSDGNYVWAKTWGGEGYDDGPGVTVDNAGNVYVAGMYASFNIDFDPAGSGVILPAHDSGSLVDVFLSKFGPDGTFKWARTWGGAGVEDAGMLVATDSANNVYITGRYSSTGCNFNPWGAADMHSSNGSFDVFVSKFDPAGTFQWAKTWGASGWDAPTAITRDNADHIYVTGKFAGSVDFDPSLTGTENHDSQGQDDAFLSMFDSNGGFKWASTWGGSGSDWSYHMTVNPAGTLFNVVGSFSATADLDPGSGTDNRNSNGMTDCFLSRLTVTQTGAESWHRYE